MKMKCRNLKTLYWMFILIAVISVQSLYARDKLITPHPRLFFNPDKLQELKNRIEEHEPAREGWERLIKKADSLLDKEFISEEYAEAGEGQHGNYGAPSSQVRDMGQTLGLAYQITKDRRYADKLKEALLYYGAYKRWGGVELTHRVPPWNSELNTARFCHGYAVGYDCIYDVLTPEEREEICDALVRLGILPTLDDWALPEKRIHALDSMGHNWWSVCVAMAGLASLSIYDDVPEAPYWVERVSSGLYEWFYYAGNVLQNKPANFDRDGAFYESVNYANYALSEYLLYRLAYGNTFPNDPPQDIPILQTAGNFFIDACYPTSGELLSLNFGDASVHAPGLNTTVLLEATGFHKEEYLWYIDRIGVRWDNPIHLVYAPIVRDAPENNFPLSRIYNDIGWAMMRDSWNDDSTLLAVKSGFTWNHAHADAGSFVLYDNGAPLLIDSGACSYSRREYTRYYVRSEAHNVVLFDGEGQLGDDVPRGVKTPGSVHRLIDAGDLKYVFADATGPTSQHFSRNYRHFLWLDDVILIVDDLRAHRAGEIEWLLHYDGEATRDGLKVRIENERSHVDVIPLFWEPLDGSSIESKFDYNQNLLVEERMGLKEKKPDVQIPFLSFKPQKPLRDTKIVTAVVLNDDGNAPRLERFHGENALGVRVFHNDTVTDVYINLNADGRRMHRNSNNVIRGWDTDAYLFALTRSKENSNQNDVESIERYFVACGSYLRKDGQVVLDSLSKIFTCVGRTEGDWSIQLQGQPVTNVYYNCSAKPNSVTVNGLQRQVDYDSGRQQLRVSTDR